MDKIELMKLYNGDIIIGEVVEDASHYGIVVKNPRVVMMMPTMAGTMSIALKPVCFPFACNRLKKEISIDKKQVMFTLHDNDGEIDTELVNGYKSDISGIQIASAADAASLASASKASGPKDFII